MSGALIWSAVTAALVLTAAAAVATLGLPRGLFFAVGALVPYLGASVIISRHFPKGTRFGPANGVTLIRLAAACVLCGLTVDQIAFGEPWPISTAWAVFAVATLAMVLDGIDGFLARRLGLESPFGARFDMEVDAFQILVLAVLADALGKAGDWVIFGGVLRYLFVAAAFVLPWMNSALPVSWRRKATAVVQGGALAALVAPVVVPPVSTVIAGAALALLIWSFAIDIAWLARTARRHQVAT